MNDIEEKSFELEKNHHDLRTKTENLAKDHALSVKSLEDKFKELKTYLDTKINEMKASLDKKTDI